MGTHKHLPSFYFLQQASNYRLFSLAYNILLCLLHEWLWNKRKYCGSWSTTPPNCIIWMTVVLLKSDFYIDFVRVNVENRIMKHLIKKYLLHMYSIFLNKNSLLLSSIFLKNCFCITRKVKWVEFEV